MKLDTVDLAMKQLLSPRQLAFIYDHTFRGPSRIQILRNLVARGIRDYNKEEREWREMEKRG